MPEHAVHPDLAAHALAGLAPAEARAVEGHVAECAACRSELERMRGTAALLERAGPPVTVPAGLQERTMRALATGSGAAPPQPGHGTRVLLAWVAAAAVLALGVFVGVLATGDDPAAPAGRLELTASLRSPVDPALTASATVRATELGRDIALRSDSLPVLPVGEFYELWFVGPGDTPLSPDRISAGTFHPDADGRSELHLHAAVDPALFPVLSVTAESGDGDPRPGREVLRFTR